MSDKTGKYRTIDEIEHLIRTITLFWVRMVREYLAVEGANRSIVELANSLIQNYGNPSLTLEYYSRDLLMSQEARRSWVEPDLKALKPVVER